MNRVITDTQEQSSRSHSPFLHLWHLHHFFRNAVTDKERRVTSHSSMHIINTLVCMSLTIVHYLFAGIFKCRHAEISTYYSLSFDKCVHQYNPNLYQNREHYHHSRKFLTLLPHQPNPQMHTVSCFCFYHNLVQNFI